MQQVSTFNAIDVVVRKDSGISALLKITKVVNYVKLFQ